jgi:hypothetical protein
MLSAKQFAEDWSKMSGRKKNTRGDDRAGSLVSDLVRVCSFLSGLDLDNFQEFKLILESGDDPRTRPTLTNRVRNVRRSNVRLELAWRTSANRRLLGGVCGTNPILSLHIRWYEGRPENSAFFPPFSAKQR